MSVMKKATAWLGRIRRRGRESEAPREPRPTRAKWRSIAIGGGLLGLAAAGLVYYAAVHAPAQTGDEAALQTATVRQGSLVISASGAGTLIARDEVDLGFQTAGEVTSVLVEVGDHVERGQVLATVDDTDAKLQVVQARRALQELTSAAAIATAKADIATAQSDLDAAIGHLSYIISPPVYHWENEIEAREALVEEAQAAAAASPNDAELQAALRAAEDALASAKQSLGGAQYSYEHSYLKNNFTVMRRDRSGQIVKYIAEPSDADILAARAAVAEATASLAEAGAYQAALTGEEIPDNSTGANLTALEQARLDLETAEDDLQGTSIVAAFSGTVMSVAVAAGDTATLGTAVITVADLDHPYLEVFLDESDWSIIEVDAPAEVTFDIQPDEAFEGRVTQVDPALYSEGSSSVVRAYVELVGVDEPGLSLPLGTAASVEVIGARAEDAVLVPVEALHKTESGRYAVFVLEDGKPRLRVVEIGIEDLLYAEVTSGLEAGETVTTGIVETQ